MVQWVFISKRVFDIIGKIKKKRIYYERLFVNIKARVLGILNNKVINSHYFFARKFYNKFKLGNKKSDL